MLLLTIQDSTLTQPIAIWPGLAPGESSNATGELQPFRPSEQPPVSRVINVRFPTMTYHPAAKPNGVSVLILPGGGFAKVVPDKEGSEAAEILNQVGISCFVLTYRTKIDAKDAGWSRALQDAQRAMKWIRANAANYSLNPESVGILGFSAGGQVAARLLTDQGKAAYQLSDQVDRQEHRPDFAMLIYPWNMYDPKSGAWAPVLK